MRRCTEFSLTISRQTDAEAKAHQTTPKTLTIKIQLIIDGLSYSSMVNKTFLLAVNIKWATSKRTKHSHVLRRNYEGVGG